MWYQLGELKNAQLTQTGQSENPQSENPESEKLKAGYFMDERISDGASASRPNTDHPDQ